MQISGRKIYTLRTEQDCEGFGSLVEQPDIIPLLKIFINNEMEAVFTVNSSGFLQFYTRDKYNKGAYFWSDGVNSGYEVDELRKSDKDTWEWVLVMKKRDVYRIARKIFNLSKPKLSLISFILRQ